MLADNMQEMQHERGGRLVGFVILVGLTVAFAIHTLD